MPLIDWIPKWVSWRFVKEVVFSNVHIAKYISTVRIPKFLNAPSYIKCLSERIVARQKVEEVSVKSA